MMRSSCIITAMSMLIDKEPRHLYTLLGHDGKDVWWPDLKAPNCFRSFHFAEFQDIVLRITSKILVCIEKFPQSAPPNHLELAKNIWDGIKCGLRFRSWINYRRGILVGIEGNIGHAWYWNGGKAIDPRDNKEYDYDNLETKIIESWLLT